MEVILKEEIRKLGSKGDVVRVANGYARNFLFPKQKAMPATAANKSQIDQMKTASDREAASLRGDADKLGEQLKELSIEITARAGDSDQLFGSVTSRDVAAYLKEKGYTIDRHKILINKPIRMVGEHEISLHIHRDIDVPMIVKVLAEGREDEPDEEDGEFLDVPPGEEGEAVAAAAETDEATVEASAEEPAEESADAEADSEAEPESKEE